MRRPLLLVVAATLMPLGAAGEPFRSGVSFQGYTGVLNTPNALIAPEGDMDFLFTDQIEERWRDRAAWEENYALSLGFLPWVEGGLRLTEVRRKPRIKRAWRRDLSAQAKAGIPSWGPYWPDLALGWQDIHSAAPHLRTQYAVASETLGPLRLSVGYGTGPDRLEGVFGGAELRALEWVHLLAEHDTDTWNVGLRLFSPDGLLPLGAHLQLTAKAEARRELGAFDWAVALRAPLGGRSGPRSGRAAVLPEVGAPALLLPAPPAAASPGAEERGLARLQGELLSLGFERVRVGMKDGQVLVVAFENSRFNHNELDGLGVALGVALARAPAEAQSFLLRICNQGLGVVDVVGPVGPFREVFGTARLGLVGPGEVDRLRPLLTVQGSAAEAVAGVAWLESAEGPRWLRTTLLLYPGLRYTIGTEVGVLDYRVSLKPELYWHLWPGAAVGARWDIPVAWSDDFDTDGLFASDNEATLEQVLFHQALPLAPNLMVLASAGQYYTDFRGGFGEVAWTPGNGNHRFRVRGGIFDVEGEREQREVLLGSYRYYLDAFDLSFEATYGQYMARDYGVYLELRRYFRDTAVTLFYSETEAKILGFRISLPLSPRRDLPPGLLQVRGPERWSVGMATTIVPRGEANYIRPGLADVPQASHNLERVYYNTGRLHEGYVREQLSRLLEAHLRWGVSTGSAPRE